jgi:hypothetical protein
VTLDEQLKKLEDDVRRLKIEFDIFFNGGVKRAPYETKGRVDSQIKRLAEERSMKYSQRFHYNTIVSRYVAFKELWRRTMQEREEGNARARQQQSVPVATQEASAFNAVQVAVISGQETEPVRHLYDSLLKAKEHCGEVNNVSFEQFQRLIETRTQQLREKMRCAQVAYEISIEEGLVKFKAKPVRLPTA